MSDKPDETMQRLTGNKEPLSGAIVEGDTGYFSEHNLQAAKQRGIAVIILDRQFRKRDARFAGRKQQGGKCRFTAEDFVYNKEKNSYRCPGKKELPYKGHMAPNRNGGETYRARRAECAVCKLRGRCIAGRGGKSPKRMPYITDKSKGENLGEEMRKK
jgi:hypothetical protein